MMKIAILGYGNIGRAAEQAVLSASDMELTGIYHHDDDLGHIEADVVLVCTPTRDVKNFAEQLLGRGISTVDSFDIHSEIPSLRSSLMPIASEHGAVAIISAGWDPGSDSVVRCLMQAMTPQGITYTNFGPGRSMGHTVAAKAIDGVRDALSMTIPLGTGVHRRMVYVELENGADFHQVEQAVLHDDYFAHDETHVIPVDSVQLLNNVAHGVLMERNGVSGTTHNQRLQFSMQINNPALTGQVMLSYARATSHLKPGAYTTIEVPPVYLLPGNVEDNIRHLV